MFAIKNYLLKNHIKFILSVFSKATDLPLVVIGNWNTSEYGCQLKQKYSGFEHILLVDPIYDRDELYRLRSNAALYVHGHSAGGTNPSLVEAMALGLPVISYDVSYNRHTTKDKAAYFTNENDLLQILERTFRALFFLIIEL